MKQHYCNEIQCLRANIRDQSTTSAPGPGTAVFMSLAGVLVTLWIRIRMILGASLGLVTIYRDVTFL